MFTPMIFLYSNFISSTPLSLFLNTTALWKASADYSITALIKEIAINCYCVHICVYTYIPKYNPFSLYNVICLYDFWAECWQWTTNWCALSQGASLLPLPAVFSCLVFFVKGCSPVGLFPPHPRVCWCQPCSAPRWGIMLLRLYECSFWCS